jgi:uncharacterized protein (DUF2147 family)
MPRSVFNICGAALLVLLAGTVHGNGKDAVVGHWVTDTSILQVALAGESLSMRVVAMKDPLYLESDDAGTPGTPRLDLNNPDPALRGQLIMGLELLSGYAYSGGKWRGSVYDPKSGNVYKSQMHVTDGELKMRGYIGLPILGRTQSFQPLSACAPHMVEMVHIAELSAAGCD